MNAASPSPLTLREAGHLLIARRYRWLPPALGVAVLVALYAIYGPPTWEASQALIIRNEASGNQDGLGKFVHADEMKTVQETILELVKSRGVLEAALTKVGPAKTPSAAEIVALRDAVKLKPPKGAEFGKTEIFYLVVRDHDRRRAVALSDALCEQLQGRFQTLRDAKAKSMVDELTKTVTLAKADLDESTARLAAIEKRVGSNLAELRFLHENGAGDSALRRTLTEINGELRQTQSVQQTDKELLMLLTAAQHDPGRLLATPNQLLESQPALRRLKEGLVDAQLRRAQIQGEMSDAHPRVRAAKEAEGQIALRLHGEVDQAVGGLELNLRVTGQRIAMLQAQRAQVTGQLQLLAELRAPYANLAAETRNRETLLQRAEQNLAEARASQANALASNLIGRVDAPDTGTNPIGPGRSATLLMGLFGGLFVGFGVMLLSMQLGPAPNAATREGSLPLGSFAPGNGLSLYKVGRKGGAGKPWEHG
jgi:uncharacterized protein involved in exopolysaccharide biosynthesis